MASLVKRSKSSVHRHQKAQARRNQYPESALWENEAGEAWLKLLKVAVLYSFGLKCHVGADKLSRFFKLIRIDTHVGISPSALRQQLSRMENLLPLFQQQCEQDALDQARSTIVAMDETFFGDFLILVLMDLILFWKTSATPSGKHKGVIYGLPRGTKVSRHKGVRSFILQSLN